ncbi:MAG: hypothetical protein PVF10_07740 [Syntrophobacterales bacterium]|jgi:hypothetical protein
MHDSNNANEMLEVTGKVLIRCFVMGLFVLFFWLGALMLAGDLAYSVHARIVPITREQFYVINYVGELMTKATVFILFLFPYIAIRLVIRKRSN